ncbi:MAG: ATP-dependent sacrificial sulfur transferase LarE [bacterium]|nr:ATP-dependent sacrificial sulfur transferase LarE [bacterium]
MDAHSRQEALFARLENYKSVLVAYSGGVDSAYLAWAAHHVLGNRSLAVTAESASYPRSHREMALRVAEVGGFSHEFVDTREMDNPDYAENASNRCYYCKSELFDVLERIRVERGFEIVAYGINSDDTGDFRPGHRAAEEHRVLSPLLDAQLSKQDIRELSRLAKLPSADLPASACLSSRIPYGMEVTPAKLSQIDLGEDALRELGFQQVRLRHHGNLARVEIAHDELAKALQPEMLKSISRVLHDQGFQYVTLDVDGYRTGSLNEVLQIQPPPERS